MTEFEQGYIAGHNDLVSDIKSRCKGMLNAEEGSDFVLDMYNLLTSIKRITNE